MEQDQLCHLAGYVYFGMFVWLSLFLEKVEFIWDRIIVVFNFFFLMEWTIFLWRLKVSFIYIFLYTVCCRSLRVFFLESMFGLNFVGNSSIHCINNKKNQQLFSYCELFS